MPDDVLTFTLRIHDPAEKKDAAKSTAWSTVPVFRSDLSLPLDEFIAKYVKPAIVADLQKFFDLQKQ